MEGMKWDVTMEVKWVERAASDGVEMSGNACGVLQAILSF